MSPLRDRAAALFVQSFGAVPELFVLAPGRVNLIGEHTDYNDGFVLPCAIDRGTVIAARPRTDGRVSLSASHFPGEPVTFALDAPFERSLAAPWSDYVRAMVRVMLDAGYALQGGDLAITGDLPQGAGLSSSASLEVAVGRVMATLAGLDVAPEALARLAQAAENTYVGMRCGIMDQLASARGQAGAALLIDCRSLGVEPIPMPPQTVVTIVHSGVARGLVEGAYNARRLQCEAAARILGVAALRDADEAILTAGAARMDAVTLRRARHVITENARTLAAADALRSGDLARMGELMAKSHASMRDDFEITVEPVDRLVALIASAIGARGGARMTGGGFGGAVVAVSDAAGAERARQAVATGYRTPGGEPPMMLTAVPSDGVAVI